MITKITSKELNSDLGRYLLSDMECVGFYPYAGYNISKGLMLNATYEEYIPDDSDIIQLMYDKDNYPLKFETFEYPERFKYVNER